MTDWAKVLRAIAPKGKSSIISGLAAAMPRVIEIAALGTMRRQAHFLAQIAHESDGFRTTVEYASGAAYEGREDLGNTQPGDGKRFKGRGLIQLTGRANYAEFGVALGVDLVANPVMASRFPYAALTAALYWRKRALNAAADADDIRGVTKKINGGYNGLAARQAYLKAAKRALAAPQAKAAPVEEEATVADLRKAGSRIVAGSDQVRNGVIGGAVSAGGAAITAAADSGVDPSDVISKVGDAAEQAKNISDAAQSAPDMLAWAQTHWEWLVIAALSLACLYFIWRAWQGAGRIARARVDDANSSLRLGG
jgi:putative chitinase